MLPNQLSTKISRVKARSLELRGGGQLISAFDSNGASVLDLTGDTLTLEKLVVDCDGDGLVVRKNNLGADVFTVDCDIGKVKVWGDLEVTGNATFTTVENEEVINSMIELATDNKTDELDIGIFGQYDGDRWSGLYRDAADSEWKLVGNLTVRPNNTFPTFDAAKLATLRVGTLKATSGLFGTSSATVVNSTDRAIQISSSGEFKASQITATGSTTANFISLYSGWTGYNFPAIIYNGTLQFNNATAPDSTGGSNVATLSNTGVFTANAISLPNGTVSAPSFRFSDASTTGIYRVTDGFAVSSGGSKVLDFLNTGLVMNSLPISGVTRLHINNSDSSSGFVLQLSNNGSGIRFQDVNLNEVTGDRTIFRVSTGTGGGTNSAGFSIRYTGNATTNSRAFTIQTTEDGNDVRGRLNIQTSGAGATLALGHSTIIMAGTSVASTAWQYVNTMNQDVSSTSSPTFAGALLGNGSVGTPSLRFTNDTGSGLYRIGSNNIGMSVNGGNVLDMNATRLQINKPVVFDTLNNSNGNIMAVEFIPEISNKFQMGTATVSSMYYIRLGILVSFSVRLQMHTDGSIGVMYCDVSLPIVSTFSVAEDLIAVTNIMYSNGDSIAGTVLASGVGSSMRVYVECDSSTSGIFNTRICGHYKII